MPERPGFTDYIVYFAFSPRVLLVVDREGLAEYAEQHPAYSFLRARLFHLACSSW